MLRSIRLLGRFLRLNRKYLVHLPRSCYFNLKYLDLRRALRLPIFISNNCRFVNLGGSVEIRAELHAGMIKIGFTTAEVFFDERYHRGAIDNSGRIVFLGNATIGQGTRIFVKSSAELIFGAHFWGTAENAISCHKRIEFGKSVLLAFGIVLMDTDTHQIVTAPGDRVLNPDKAIVIGDRVWIGCNATILKGTEIKEQSIVGAGAVVSRRFERPNVIIAGNPARVVREGISWVG